MVKVLYDKEKKEYIVLPKGDKRGFYLDGYLKKNLEFIKKDVRDDSDGLLIVSGKERGGKSVCAMQIGKYLDPSMTLDRVCFNPKEFKDQVLKAEKYQVIIFDEAITGMRAVRWAGDVNQMLVELLAQIGQKNLVILIVIPSFFELQKYIALHRSVALIHVYRSDGKRGFFRVYDENRKVRLYMLGKKLYDYSVASPNFYGRFMNTYVLDEAEYRRKKLLALTKPEVAVPPKFQKAYTHRDGLIKYMAEEMGRKDTEISRIVKDWSGDAITARNVGDIRRGKVGVAL